MNICEYTTVSAVKDYVDQHTTTTLSDALFLKFIRQASREIDAVADRWFYPRHALEYYDTPGDRDLILDHDLLEVVSLTNGDGTSLTADTYKLYPLNQSIKWRITLLPGTIWQRLATGVPYGAIALAGVLGYHPDYASAWEDSGATLSAAITTITQTTVTVPTGKIAPGDLLKVDSEYLYASAVVVGTTDTLTLTRGVNGSSAAAHLISTPVYRYNPGAQIEMLATRAAAAYSKLQANPIGDTVTVDGLTFNTPKDVLVWMRKQLDEMGYIATGAI